MRMNVFEMEGFLRGRCVPRDLKVNETDAEYLVRKLDALEAKCAALENKVIPVSAELPPANESVLLFDANGEGWLIGWRSLWYTWGQKETGEWQWTWGVGGRRFKSSRADQNSLKNQPVMAGFFMTVF